MRRNGHAPAVALRDLRMQAGGRTILALSGWTVEPGAQVLVLGPSGSGKTSLLNAIAGLRRIASGTIEVAGEDIGALAADARDRFRGRKIGIVFQTLHLVAALEVADNLRLARWLARLAPDEARIAAVLEALGLAEKAHQKPRSLSQGEAQRVAIARAVVNAPALILADEPTSALDDRNAQSVVDLLSDQAEACGAALVIATHDARIKDRFATQLELGGGG